MLGADLVRRGAAPHRGADGCRTGAAEVDAALWLKVDSFSLLQALAYLAGRLVDEYEVKLVHCACARADGARAARPGLERPGDEHRDRDELGDRRHSQAATRAAR
jgi:hypothetical protein